MRVVSGKCKGKALKAVPGHSTRPTTDKVKEAIFNMIGPYFDGGLCLDLFAGSGNLGIEALSRGIEKGIFVDRDRKAIQTIKENVSTCSLEENVEIYRNDAKLALKAVKKRGLTFDLIFLDPPYGKQSLIQLLTYIDEHGLIAQDGIVICEHHVDLKLPPDCGKLTKYREENYGMIKVSLYRQ